MLEPTMLYSKELTGEGQASLQDGSFVNYIVVDSSDIEAKLKEGWLESPFNIEQSVSVETKKKSKAEA